MYHNLKSVCESPPPEPAPPQPARPPPGAPRRTAGAEPRPRSPRPAASREVRPGRATWATRAASRPTSRQQGGPHLVVEAIEGRLHGWRRGRRAASEFFKRRRSRLGARAPPLCPHAWPVRLQGLRAHCPWGARPRDKEDSMDVAASRRRGGVCPRAPARASRPGEPVLVGGRVGVRGGKRSGKGGRRPGGRSKRAVSRARAASRSCDRPRPATQGRQDGRGADGVSGLAPLG